MNSILAIHPCKSDGLWIFGDEKAGLAQKPFVSGADIIIEHMVQDMSGATDGFTLIFSASPFPGYQTLLEWRRESMGGNWYYCAVFDLEGWLCPAPFKYFERGSEDLRADEEVGVTLPRGPSP